MPSARYDLEHAKVRHYAAPVSARVCVHATYPDGHMAYAVAYVRASLLTPTAAIIIAAMEKISRHPAKAERQYDFEQEF